MKMRQLLRVPLLLAFLLILLIPSVVEAHRPGRGYRRSPVRVRVVRPYWGPYSQPYPYYTQPTLGPYYYQQYYPNGYSRPYFYYYGRGRNGFRYGIQFNF